MTRQPKTITSQKNKGIKVKSYSWHFWLMLILTVFALFLGYRGKNPLMGSIVFGAMIYFSPWFLCVVRGWMPRSLMLKFYKKHKH